MTDFIIVIPSNKRIDTLKNKTAKFIDHYKLSKFMVDVFVPENQVGGYQQAFPDYDVLVGPQGYTETFNHIYSKYNDGTNLLMLHDDVEKFQTLDENGKLRDVEVDEFLPLIKKMFHQMREENIHLGGFYPCRNNGWMSKAKPISKNLTFIIDPVSLHINKRDAPRLTLRFDGHEHSKQDVENSILHFIQDGAVLRYNHYCFKSKYAPKGDTTGVGERSQDREMASAKGIVEKYPAYAYLRHNKKGPQVGLRRKLKY